jgi:hypothetical protein
MNWQRIDEHESFVLGEQLWQRQQNDGCTHHTHANNINKVGGRHDKKHAAAAAAGQSDDEAVVDFTEAIRKVSEQTSQQSRHLALILALVDEYQAIKAVQSSWTTTTGTATNVRED